MKSTGKDKGMQKAGRDMYYDKRYDNWKPGEINFEIYDTYVPGEYFPAVL